MAVIGIRPMPYEEFVALPNGTEIRNHGFSECVAVANQYHQGVQELPLPEGFTSAFEWWTRRHEKPEIYENYDFSPTPAPGAMFVAKGGIYDPLDGHIGNVTGVREGGFTTLEQNTGTGMKRFLYRYFRVKDPNVYGFLIPKINPALPPVETPHKRRSKTMLGMRGADGEGRYGPKGAEIGLTYDGRALVFLPKKDADPISVYVNEDQAFANVSYHAIEGYWAAAEVVVDARVNPPTILKGPNAVKTS